jgi:hypothetical protein
MVERKNPIFSDIVPSLNWGAHLCSIYRNKKEQLAVVLPYLAFGLKHEERCLYIGEEGRQEDLCRGLKSYGLDAEDCMRNGQFIFLTKEETYLKDNFFSPLAMLDLIINAHYEALKAGYKGLRGSGETNWVAQDDIPSAKRVIDYERDLNLLFLRNHLIALCQYNEDIVPEDILQGVIYTHPKTVFYGKFYDNPFYVPPHLFKEQADQEYQVGSYHRLRNRIIEGK